jgi:hypothetical protein
MVDAEAFGLSEHVNAALPEEPGRPGANHPASLVSAVGQCRVVSSPWWSAACYRFHSMTVTPTRQMAAPIHSETPGRR